MALVASLCTLQSSKPGLSQRDVNIGRPRVAGTKAPAAVEEPAPMEVEAEAMEVAAAPVCLPLSFLRLCAVHGRRGVAHIVLTIRVPCIRLVSMSYLVRLSCRLLV